MYSIFMFRNLITLVAQIGNMFIEMVKIEFNQNQTVCLVLYYCIWLLYLCKWFMLPV